MHQIEPYYSWLKYYDSAEDERSPFFGKEYNYDLYSETIYGYYIDPAWDFMGSETLYIKVLFVDYVRGFAIIEFIGEWNDAINNDIMHLKRNIIDHFLAQGVRQFILVGENIMNFHGSDDSYYEEWFDDVEDYTDGWLAAVNLPDFIMEEMKNYNIDAYINMGGSLQVDNWRVMMPVYFYEYIKKLVMGRIALT